MKNYIRIIIAFSLCLMAFMPQGDQTLAKVQNKFKSIRNFSADFSQNTGAGSSSSSSMRGKVYYEKDEKYRIEMKNLVIVSDGKTIWSYTRKQNKVVISQPGESTQMFSLKKLLIDNPKNQTVESLKNESVGPESCSVIKIIAKNTAAGFEYLKIWADSQFLPRKIEIRQGDVPMIFELSNYNINQNLPASRFAFDAPKGCKIVDIR